MVYVTPTEDMGIQQSRFVDASGLVYLPYLSEWKQVSVCVWGGGGGGGECLRFSVNTQSLNGQNF